MSAILIDLKDFDVRTPEQAVRIFLSMYSTESVYAQLMEIFIACAENNPRKDNQPDPQTNRIANLFDHLIALTTALHQLREKTLGRCVICGRTPKVEEEAG